MTTHQISVTGMPGRYATALFELALESKALARVEKELKGFAALLDKSSDLRRLVTSPVFSTAEQERAIGAVLDKAKIGGITANFIKLVIANRRLFAVRDMIAAFAALVATHRGEITAEVVSATPLSAKQMTALKLTLKAVEGREVNVETQVDESLLGGLIVKIGSRMVDNSLSTKLDNLKIAMKEVG